MSGKILHIAFQNEREGYLALGRVPGSPYAVERAEPLICAWWTRPGGRIHNVLLVDPAHPGPLRAHLEPLLPRMDASASSTEVRLTDDSLTPDAQRDLEALGFRPAWDAPVMACDPSDGHPGIAPAAAIAIRPAADDRTYADSLRVVDAIYRSSPDLNRFFAGRGAVRLYTGYWDGVPACSGALWPYAGAAGIYSLATLPAYRRRGLAYALLQRQLADAAAEGFPLAVLRTTDDLIPFYERLGFRVAGRLRAFVRP